MTQFQPFIGGRGVSLRQRTVVQTITYAARTSESRLHSTISVPNSNIKRAEVFMPPGTNYSVKIQLGFNGQVMIPSDNIADYIIGSNWPHVFEWGIDAYGPVDVWALCNNSISHTIYIRLDLDLQAVIDYAQPTKPLRLL